MLPDRDIGSPCWDPSAIAPLKLLADGATTPKCCCCCSVQLYRCLSRWQLPLGPAAARLGPLSRWQLPLGPAVVRLGPLEDEDRGFDGWCVLASAAALPLLCWSRARCLASRQCIGSWALSGRCSCTTRHQPTICNLTAHSLPFTHYHRHIGYSTPSHCLAPVGFPSLPKGLLLHYRQALLSLHCTLLNSL